MLAFASAFALLFNPLVLAQEVPTGQPASDPTVNPPIFTPGSGPGQVPTLNPGSNPTYNPSEDPSNTLQIPSVDSKPTGGPSEETPSSPDLTKVPFGKPGNVVTIDTTKITEDDGPPSTAKLELLDKQSDLDAELIFSLDKTDLEKVEKLIGDKGVDSTEVKKSLDLYDDLQKEAGSKESGQKLLDLVNQGVDVSLFEGLKTQNLDSLVKNTSITQIKAEDRQKAFTLYDKFASSGVQTADADKFLELVSQGIDASIFEGLKVENLGSLVNNASITQIKAEDRQKAFTLYDKFASSGVQTAVADKLLVLMADPDISIANVEKLDDKNFKSLTVVADKLDAKLTNDILQSDSTKRDQFLRITESPTFDVTIGKIKSESAVKQLLKLNSSVISNVANIDLSEDSLITNESFAKIQKDLIDPNNPSLASLTDHLEKASSSGGVDENFHLTNVFATLDKMGDADTDVVEIRRQIASLLLLEALNDNFHVEGLDPIDTDDNGNPVYSHAKAKHQLSDFEKDLGLTPEEIEKHFDSATEIIEELNELNTKLYLKLSPGTSGTSGAQRRDSHTKTVEAHKTEHLQLVIDEVYNQFGSSLPVSKEDIHKMITVPHSPTDDHLEPEDIKEIENEEHHFKEIMNLDTPLHFAQYIETIVPDESEAVQDTGHAAFSNQLSNLKSRLSNVRLAQMGFPASDGLVNAMVTKAFEDIEKEDLYLAQANGTLTEEVLQKVLSEEASVLKNGFFVQASASFTEDDFHQMDGDSWGISFGVDQEIIDNFSFGIMGGFGKSDSSNPTNQYDTDSIFAGIYANFVRDMHYIESFLTFGFHGSDTERADSTNGGIYEASPNSNQYTFGITYGKAFQYEGLLFTPSLGFTYDNYTTSGYSESDKILPGGAVSNKASFDELTDESFVSSLGAKIAYHIFNPDGSVIIPEFRASWEHNFNADPTRQGVHLLSHGRDDTFYVNGRPEDSDFGFIGTGVTTVTNSGRSMYLHYDYLIGKSDFDAHFLNLGFRILF